MTIKTYLKNLQTESNVKGLWYYDDFLPNPNILSQFEEFKNISVEFIKDIRKEHINSMIILKNLCNIDFKNKIRIYSIYFSDGNVYYNISKDSLKNI